MKYKSLKAWAIGDEKGNIWPGWVMATKKELQYEFGQAKHLAGNVKVKIIRVKIISLEK